MNTFILKVVVGVLLFEIITVAIAKDKPGFQSELVKKVRNRREDTAVERVEDFAGRKKIVEAKNKLRRTRRENDQTIEEHKEIFAKPKIIRSKTL